MMNVLPGSMSRVAIPAFGACLVTLSLFYLMVILIQTEDVQLQPESIRITEYVRIPELRELILRNSTPKKPKQPDEPPPIPDIAISPVKSNYGTNIIKPVEAPPGLTPGGYSDGEFLPLVKVQPVYPRAAISRGLEGYTVVEFDVGADGSVRNPRVIEYHPSPVFNRASINAVLKFRYKPMIKGGTPTEVIGVQNRFTFELTN